MTRARRTIWPGLALGLCLLLAGNGGLAAAKAPAAGGDKAPTPGRWRTYANCRLVEGAFQDGDSFHVKLAGGTERIFRLYYVDCPEGDEAVPERVATQAAYWGVTTGEILAFGAEAAAFTRQFLQAGFSVQTRYDDAFGRSHDPRYYGFVRAGPLDLAEELVRRGLARAYGYGINLPDGTDRREVWRRLDAAEQAARRAKAGIWKKAQQPAARPLAPASRTPARKR